MVKFVDSVPPARTNKASKHAENAKALREKPGMWAIVAEGAATGMSSAINSGSYAAYRPKGEFEATARSEGDGKYTVYARYIGSNNG